MLAPGETARIVESVGEWLGGPEAAERILADLRAAHALGERSGHAKAEIKRLERARSAILELIESGMVTDTRVLAERLEGIQRALVDSRE